MELKLQFNGSADGLINYLENFLKIRPTLLLEVDTKEHAFVAKGLVEDRSSVRYSVLKFEDTNLLFVSDSVQEHERIHIGILNKLDTLVKILKRFNDELKQVTDDGKIKSPVDMVINYAESFNDSHADVLAASSITFKTKKLSMKFDCFKVSEFKCMTDSQFMNGVFRVSNETRFVLNQEIIKEVISATDIFSSAATAREDILVFNVLNNGVLVSDNTNDKESHFKMVVSEKTNSVSDEIHVAIKRDTFLRMLGKVESDYEVIIGYSEKRDGTISISRVLFASTVTPTKIAISTVTVG